MNITHTKQKIKYDYLKHIIKYPISRTSRKFIREYHNNKHLDFYLIMTILVKNEQDILEKQIRFHKAMGVDSFIATSHNSTDKTNEILEKLKKEGLILDIIYETDPIYHQSKFVNKMINLAKNKYNADWIINADADEFYYSKHLNLKADIAEAIKAGLNNLWVDSTFLFPTDEQDYLRDSHYFVIKPFQNFEAKNLEIKSDKIFEIFIGSQGCTKVIHNTKDFKEIYMGNHSIKMRNNKAMQSSTILLYHYHIRNYQQQKEKVLRYIDTQIPNGGGTHMLNMINLYKQGKLRESYEAQFGARIKDFLLKEGVIAIDKSVSNFLRWQGIIK